MKLFRKLRVFALLVAVLALVTGFIVFNAPKTADARLCGACMVRICLPSNPHICWWECRPCLPLGP